MLSDSHLLALRFARAAIDNGQHIDSVFFYQQAVGVAFQTLDMAADEANFQKQWLSLAGEHLFPLQVCIAAAARRGLNELLTARYEANGGQSCFEIVGLGQLAATLSKHQSRLIHFR